MMKPEMLIGTDRMELYEFFARRKEVLTGLNKGWFKFSVGVTIVHGVIV